ncbi:hypothetical protein DTO006G1_8202 [Penicillium roqueforti]|uniref:uncharacterized protein n=1 Tax=Penicillium roqueforti TaxID=5082 RepID=UPI0019090C94|nr:uncharacterized protein LCP9604111_8840 [Penicillium roqueforti]KAF9240362.1 hypothetical protein LCP9604111_8840 [Penicillium roqueforti]KAI1835265.1 hypothetical protein CBS147337_4082 [Penicillium roqueforti]KAI2677278.1 hypothetical protein CBS147355_5505 [Penicillium roqueforti]KAI2688425.1 hypothetical protein LCP963914a_2827 [Penicillium roqueforti]KAI2720004.1 hypothetical protein CBS147318_3310 [Penicillium roqueforti]
MLPAAPDDIIRQHSRLPEDDSPFAPDQHRTISEHEPSAKGKKKKGKKNKVARAATETPPDDIIQPYDPLPEEPLSCPDPEPFIERHVNPSITSPVLDVLGSLDEPAGDDLTSRTDTWAQSVPYGKSPPTDLMDGDIPSASLPSTSPLNFPTIQERSGFSHPSSASPQTRTLPSSYGNAYRSGLHSRQQSIDRRKSHSYGSPMSNHAPPPHLPQAHFFGAPDIEIIPTQNRSPAEGNYSFCGFDTLPSLSSKGSRTGMNVLLVGIDGAVEILAIEDRQTRLVGQITGLNGRVIEAKLLPGYPSSDPFASSRPHVAVIVHGPLPPHDEEGRVSSATSDANEIPPSTIRGHSYDKCARDDIQFYQTRVEIYSFRTSEHVCTLFASKPVPCLENLPGLPSFAPSPVGKLKIFTTGAYIILASGVSGEVYVYRHILSPETTAYQCLGKTWTGVQSKETRRYSTSSSSTTDPEGTRTDSPHGFSTLERPILAVQGRWLAFAPPPSAYRGSIQGTVPSSLIIGKVPGIETRSPPAVPSVSCATDVGEGESFFDKMARGVAQELVRGARWMGDQGMQAWNNYWNTQQPSGSSPRRPPQGLDLQTQGYGLFPPTHAQDTQTSATEPDTVSIIDLRRFEDGTDIRNAFIHPVSTFQVPNGCSFLSLSPNGLMLFTASKKGDVQYVWDLMQLKHCRSMAFMADDQTGQNPNVRQIARYARLTTSSIVDVIWTAPVGDRLAVITRKGTVHVFDLPRSAFQWPPFRRAKSTANKPPATDPMADEMTSQASGSNPLSAAMKLVGGKTQPFFSAVRGRVPSTGAAFPNMSGFALPSAASVKSGKVVAAGLSKSMGAATGTVNTLRHAGENRLHLPGLARDPAPSRVTWICNKGLIFLGVLDAGYFKMYRLKRATVPGHKSRQPHSIVGGKESQVKLPDNLQGPCGPAPLSTFDPEVVVHASIVLPSVSYQPSSAARSFCQPLSQAEIETNTPYQPFHTDQRVSLSVFSSGSDASEPSGQWVFGNDIPLIKVHLRSFNSSSDDHGDDEDENAVIHGHSLGAGGDIENLITLGNSTGNVEEVVITTRRKKRHSAPLKADDGFFEDDCEVLDFARDRV